MKKALFFALALAVICGMASCKKDPLKGTVVFGNTHGMSVTSYDSTFHIEQYSHDSWGNTVDLNGDGQDDVQFHSQVIGSPAVGRAIVTELICHEDIALLGDIINQQQFLHIDTVGSATDDSIHWVVYINHTITCNQIAETDSVLSTNEKFSLYANNAGQSFDADNTFMSTNVTLKNRSYYYPIGSETIENMVYQHMHDGKNDCDTFPMEEEKYIGFKITKNGRSQLGWMKVILHHDHVELLETAIKK